MTGIKKALEPYKVGDSSTDVVLCVSNMWKDVQISKLSEDDFEEVQLISIFTTHDSCVGNINIYCRIDKYLP